MRSYPSEQHHPSSGDFYPGDSGRYANFAHCPARERGTYEVRVRWETLHFGFVDLL